MTKILISTFPQESYSMTAVGIDGTQDKVKFHLGFDQMDKLEDIKNSALSSFFISLIIHDEIYVSVNDFKEIVNGLGAHDTLSLLDRKIIKVVNGTENVVLLEGKETQGKLILTGIRAEMDAMARFERHINTSNLVKVSEKPTLIQYTNNAKIEVSEDIYKITRNEVARDLSNKTFQHLGLTTETVNDINRADALKLLRIANTTEQLILQNQLGIDSIAQDGFGKEYLNTKLGAFSQLAGKDSVSPFENISKLKGIPDLYNLYKRGSITMESILACRDAFSGGLFRKWYSSTDYNEQKILQVLLNKSDKESSIWKTVRLIYPNIIGVIEPVSGFAASAIDSYIVGKIIEGWSPSLFLDDVFKRKIDMQIEKNDLLEKRAEFVRRFGKVDRNEPCPCQSGLKYKKCHGK